MRPFTYRNYRFGKEDWVWAYSHLKTIDVVSGQALFAGGQTSLLPALDPERQRHAEREEERESQGRGQAISVTKTVTANHTNLV